MRGEVLPNLHWRSVRRWASWSLFVVVVASANVALAAEPAAETALFAFDDHAIPWKHNLQLTLVEATKHPDNPVLRCGPAGSPDHGHAVLYGSVLHIDGKYRMWYLGMSQRTLERGQAPGYWRPMCYAESDDGVKWTKPELNLVDLNGTKKNNICLIESELHSLTRVNDFLTVIHEPDDPDSTRRYKAAYIAHMPFAEVNGGRSGIGPNEGRWGSMICATSADGLRWKVIGDRPANAGGERFEVSGLYHFGDFFYATGQLISPWTWLPDGRDVGRVMLAYRSPDFQSWSKSTALSFLRPGQLLANPIPGQQTHMGAGLWNRGNVLVGLYGMWQDGPKDRPKGSTHLHGTRIDLGLVVSNDGIHFREPVADFKVIPRGKDGEWDNIALLQGHSFANVGDQTYLWYSHWDCEGQFRSQEIGLATMRRDGFGYLSRHAKESSGHFVTAAATAELPDSSVYVNVDKATAEAPLVISLVDQYDRPLAGFSGADAAKITESGVRKEVIWPKSKRGTIPEGAKIAVRGDIAVNSDARVYAVYLAPSAGK